MKGAEIDTVILCATPRSGSTLLCSVLNASGVVGTLESWFRAEDRASYAEEWGLELNQNNAYDPTKYLSAVKTSGRGANGIVGIRIMWETLHEILDEYAPLYPGSDASELLTHLFGRFRLIYLRRADTLAQAVSRLKAEQSGHWHTIGDWIEQIGPADGPLTYDAQAIAAYKADAEAGHAGWLTFFETLDLPYISVDYDDLAEDPVATTRSILAALNLQAPNLDTLEVHNVRLSDDINRSWIARFIADTQNFGE